MAKISGKPPTGKTALNPLNSTGGFSLPFPWKEGEFGRGSIIGPDVFPDSLNRKGGPGPDSRTGGGMGKSMGLAKQ